MPLIACPECSREVSTLAVACPGCGCPQSAFQVPEALTVETVVPEPQEDELYGARLSQGQGRYRDRTTTNRGTTPAFIDSFIRGFDFESRTCRSDYWHAFFTALVLFVVLLVVDVAAGFVIADRWGDTQTGVLSTLFSLVWSIPWLSLNVRRLHDVGMSGWNLLWALTGVGVFGIIYWQSLPSEAAQARPAATQVSEHLYDSEQLPPSEMRFNLTLLFLLVAFILFMEFVVGI